jgi:hypothetical protein
VFFCAMVGAMTFFISLELAGPSQFPGTERSTKSLRRKFFAISRIECSGSVQRRVAASRLIGCSMDEICAMPP